MKNALFGFFLILAIGSAWESRAQLAHPSRSFAATPTLVGTWTLVGTTSEHTTRKAKSTSTVTTTTVRCNMCPEVLFLPNGRGAILAEGSPDTLNRFRWQLNRQVLTLRVVGPKSAGVAALPTGTYRLRPATQVGVVRRIDLLDNQGVAYQLAGSP